MTVDTFEAHGLGIDAVWVPPGVFRMGSDDFDSDDRPVHQVQINPGFWLGRFPVMNAEYEPFAREHGGPDAISLRTRGLDALGQPVTGVTWYDARGFCDWFTRGLGRGYTADLPTEAEWEWAATGPDGRRYPWGNEPPTAQRAHTTALTGAHGPALVRRRPAGRGPYGAEDQAGNVLEWCLSAFEPYGDTDVEARVVRGGGWFSSAKGLRCTSRGLFSADGRAPGIGFRVVFRGRAPESRRVC